MAWLETPNAAMIIYNTKNATWAYSQQACVTTTSYSLQELVDNDVFVLPFSNFCMVTASLTWPTQGRSLIDCLVPSNPPCKKICVAEVNWIHHVLRGLLPHVLHSGEGPGCGGKGGCVGDIKLGSFWQFRLS